MKRVFWPSPFPKKGQQAWRNPCGLVTLVGSRQSGNRAVWYFSRLCPHPLFTAFVVLEGKYCWKLVSFRPRERNRGELRRTLGWQNPLLIVESWLCSGGVTCPFLKIQLFLFFLFYNQLFFLHLVQLISLVYFSESLPHVLDCTGAIKYFLKFLPPHFIIALALY